MTGESGSDAAVPRPTGAAAAQPAGAAAPRPGAAVARLAGPAAARPGAGAAEGAAEPVARPAGTVAAGGREVTDPKAMRALAHPLRLELLDQLSRAGTLTAAQASELVGETPANCSFHLRTLAKYGFVEQAGGGHGRERPWRRVPGGVGVSELTDGSPLAVSALALTDVIVNRHLETIRRYRAAVHPGLPPEWQQLSGHASVIAHLTLDELGQLRADLLALLSRYAGRSAETAARPAGSRPVQLFTFTMPAPSDPSSADADPPSADAGPSSTDGAPSSTDAGPDGADSVPAVGSGPAGPDKNRPGVS